jgi:excisionase family DNA binding protein
MSDHLMTSVEVAELLRATPRFVRRLVAERRIAYVKCGRKVLFESAAVQAYIDANRVDPLTRDQLRAELWRAA